MKGSHKRELNENNIIIGEWASGVVRSGQWEQLSQSEAMRI